ncbi:hypothetical protein IFR04_006394 [Cadophora malorum]|uniref:Uncharacterized protein n=1 Tax=Cadophora malorum TaxID=108018 RepID=A0A8H7TIU9_9HELO|nr:hypothetical protein IFR04_006394 [Cadophora malorum]
MSSAAIPKVTKAGTIEGQDDFESLKFRSDVPILALSNNKSIKVVKIESVISVIGFVKGLLKEQPGCLDVLRNLCTIRTLLVKIRTQFKDMNRTIEANSIKLVVDKKAFFFKEAKEAYQYIWDQKHFGKLTIKIE